MVLPKVTHKKRKKREKVAPKEKRKKRIKSSRQAGRLTFGLVNQPSGAENTAAKAADVFLKGIRSGIPFLPFGQSGHTTSI